ncbi:galactosyl transferase GMA12/MNN10 family-domain-containing protein [Dipodascopsis tothii]|uniref:galactosyl transferase GMA12/MNN10 family-domain-containing protein n=1 Tax=Dipodascopsis tothii TaxID=44089 RepID=UPI0034CE193A
MHFSLPARASDRSLPGSSGYKPRRGGSSRNVRTTAVLAGLVLAGLLALWVAGKLLVALGGLVFGAAALSGPGSEFRAVMVLPLDRTIYKDDHLAKVIENRKEYADAHGFGLFVQDIQEHSKKLAGSPKSWAKILVMRDAMAKYPGADVFWYLDQTALIMNPNIDLVSDIVEPKKLNGLMLRDVPVVPPDSVIRTYRHVPADRMRFIISQDHEGFQPTSFVLRNGLYANYVLDAWFDKLYRSYSFAKDDRSALEHLAQWHPTALSKMAVVPQRTFAAYPSGVPDAQYADGDFVISFVGCDSPERSCVREFDRYWDDRGRVVKK